jgi:NADH-quinone oxidoreductase subunit M
MGIYPESFMAPMRADIGHLEARLAQAKPVGDARVTPGAVTLIRNTGEGSAR